MVRWRWELHCLEPGRQYQPLSGIPCPQPPSARPTSPLWLCTTLAAASSCGASGVDGVTWSTAPATATATRVQSSLRPSGSRRRCLPAALLPVQGPFPPVSPWSIAVPCARDDKCRIRGTPSTDAGTWRLGEGLASRPCVFGSLLCFSLLSPGGSSTQEEKTLCYSGAAWCEYILRRNRNPTTWIATDRSATSKKESALDLIGQSCGRVLPVPDSSMPTSPPPSRIIISLELTSVNSGIQDLDYASTPSTS